MNLNKIEECLIKFASTDETRPHLEVINFNEKLEMVVSTDGQRLFATKCFYDKERAGKSFRVDVFKTCGELVEKEDEYPNIMEAIPKKGFDCVCHLKIPRFLSKFKSVNNAVIRLGVDLRGENASLVIEPNGLSKGSVGFNGVFLASLAGEEVKMFFNGPLDPFVITESDAKTPFDNEWFALIMPMRQDGDCPVSPCVKVDDV